MQFIKIMLTACIVYVHTCCSPFGFDTDAATSGIIAKPVKCGSLESILVDLKSAVGIVRSPKKEPLPVAKAVVKQQTCDCSPFAYCLPFYPTIMIDWQVNTAQVLQQVHKDNPSLSGSVYDVYTIASRLGVPFFLSYYPQAQPDGLQLYNQAQQDPLVQDVNDRVKKLAAEGADLKTRVEALAVQTSVTSMARQKILKQIIPTFLEGGSIKETIVRNNGRFFDQNGINALQGNIYASLGTMSDQRTVDPKAFAAYQALLQSYLPFAP